MPDQAERNEKPDKTHVEGDFVAGDEVIHGDKTRDKYVINLPSVEPPVRINTIPRPTTGDEYVERTLEAAVEKALRNHKQVGVTGEAGLAGMGGVGKTEMAIRIALRLEQEFEGGVLWVPFKEREPFDILRDVAADLDVGIDPQADQFALAEQVKKKLEGCELLLVYDDIRPKHLDDYEALFRPPPTCALLITTRLRRLGTLPPGALYRLDVFTQEEAREAMRRILGDETCDAEPEGLDRVIELCWRLALAVAVAAWRIKEERDLHGAGKPIAGYIKILEGERGRLTALKADLPGRKLDVLAVQSASYTDLDEEMQRRYDVLDVFAGDDFPSWAVAGLWGMDGEEAVKRALGDLVERSMLQAVGEGRYRLHDLWREFARERLSRDADAEQAARRAHAEAFAVYAWRYWDLNDVPILAREYADLAAAVEWARAAGEADLLFRLAWATHDLMYFSGRWKEGRAWLEAALDALGEGADEGTKKRHSNLRSALADFAYRSGNYPEARELMQESLEIDKSLEDRRGVAVMQGKLANLAMRRGDYDEAERLFKEAVGTMQELGERQQAAAMQGALADLAMQRGDYDEAERLYRAALAVHEELDETRNVAVTQGGLADLAYQRGNYDEAERLYRAAIDVLERVGDKRELAVKQAMLAQVLIATGRREEGCALLHEAAGTLRAIGATPDADAADGWIALLCEGGES